MDPQSSARGGWSDFWAIVFVAAVPLAIFWDATLGLVLLAPGDAIVMALPNRQLVAETLGATTSERQGRIIDFDGAGSMERKKQEGYF